MARADLTAVELEVVAEVKRAYYDVWIAEQSLSLTERERELLEDMVRIATSRYQTGAVSQQDVLRAQLETVALDNDLLTLRQQRSAAQARLARLMHISPETDLGAESELPPEPILDDIDPLYAAALDARPELRAQRAAVARDRRSVELADLQYRPDVTAGTMYMDMPSGQDALVSGVSMNVPLYRKRLSAAVLEAEANVATNARRYDALQDRTQQEVKELFTQIQSQREMLRLFREDIMPRARQTLDVSLEAYQVGNVDFLQLIDNWRQLLKFQLAYHRLEGQQRQSVAALERLVGPLP